jgi:hypothetical protein
LADPDAVAEIWVAAGRYSPGPAVWTDYFDIPAGCEVYGGFAGLETARTQRQWSRYRTYLDGHGLNRKIVNITNANDLANPVILDGFYLHQARMFAIDINNSSPIISHCVLIANNAGIDIDSNSQPIIANNVIAINDQSGISLATTNYKTEIRNNTIAYNSIGVLTEQGSPALVNNIIWHNDQQVSDLCVYAYSCVQDFNDPNNTTTPDANGNITANPLFVAEYDGNDPNSFNWHIDFDNSPCIDKGNDPNIASGELDIDGNIRIYGFASDMGADEATCNDLANVADIYNDGIVNFGDFALLSEAWLSNAPADPNYPLNWNPVCDINNDDMVNTADLALLLNEWLWQACYNLDYVAPTMLMEPQTTLLSRTATKAAPIELTIAQQQEQLQQAIDWLPQLWLQAPEKLSKDQLYILQDFQDQLIKDLEKLQQQAPPALDRLAR